MTPINLPLTCEAEWERAWIELRSLSAEGAACFYSSAHQCPVEQATRLCDSSHRRLWRCGHFGWRGPVECDTMRQTLSYTERTAGCCSFSSYGHSGAAKTRTTMLPCFTEQRDRWFGIVFLSTWYNVSPILTLDVLKLVWNQTQKALAYLTGNRNKQLSCATTQELQSS